MSVKTAIDLETLGAPSNDSEGIGCYISEKGIQALPSKIEMVEGLEDNGIYLCKFFMCGKTYHVFEKKIVGEDGSPVDASFLQFDKETGALSLVPNQEGFFGESRKREIKTVSYMTLTNPEMKLFYRNTQKEYSFKVKENILALFSNNIIAFKEEGNKFIELTFIKNPTFLSYMKDDVTEKSPLQVYAFRAFTLPLTKLGSAQTCGTANAKFENESYESYLQLHEETIVVYDRETGKVKAVSQRRRRMLSDGGRLLHDDKHQLYVLIYPDNYQMKEFPYIYTNCIYSDLEGLNEIGNFRVQFGYKYWTDSADPIGELYAKNWPDVYLFNHYSLFMQPAGQINEDIKCFLNTDKGGIKETAQLFRHYTNALEYNVEYAPTEFLTVNEKTTIDDIRNYVDKNIRNNDKLLTPDNFNYRVDNPNWLMLFQVQDEPYLWSDLGEFHTQEYLWGQRSRTFSLGTQVFSNWWPVRLAIDKDDFNTLKNMELRKFQSIEWIGNSNFSPNVTEIEVDESSLLQFDDLSNMRITIKKDDSNFFAKIYSLFDWPTIDTTVEYKNAVYHTRVGEFGIAVADKPYFVPSNISDKIIGLYGENRDILAISQKSIERFNISDVDVSPVQFTQVEKTYDMLVDWSGLNGRLDMLTKELGEFLFNGVPRINKYFSLHSRILPATMIKGIRMDVVDLDTMYLCLVDAKGRAFLASRYDSAISAITLNEDAAIFADSYGAVWRARLDDGNEEKFSVEWTYRTGRNILLSKISARTAQHGGILTNPKRNFRLYKNGNPIRERLTREQTVDFYKIGRGLNSRLKLETSGYLREIEITDTERGQK